MSCVSVRAGEHLGQTDVALTACLSSCRAPVSRAPRLGDYRLARVIYRCCQVFVVQARVLSITGESGSDGQAEGMVMFPARPSVGSAHFLP